MSLPRTTTYSERVRTEIEHCAAVYQDGESRRPLAERMPPSFKYTNAHAQELGRAANEGRWFHDEIVARIESHPGGRILSLGSGPGGLEIEIARRLAGLAP